MRNIEERLTPEQKQMARRRRILQGRAAQGACIFAALLAVSLLFGCTLAFGQDRTFSDSENRMLAQRPEITWRALADGSFGEQLESWYDDQAAGRDRWLSLSFSMRRLLGVREISGVYLGADDYLIQTAEQPDEAQLEKTEEAVLAFAAQYPDVRMTAAIVPNACGVLTQKLPADAPVADQRAQIDAIDAALSGVQAVNVTDALRAHSAEALYYRTDHHWTSLAARYAFEALAPSLGIEDPVSGYTVYPVSDSFEGTLSAKTGSHAAKDMVSIYVPETDVQYAVTYADTQKTVCSLYDRAKLAEKNQYEVFFGGNHARVDIRTTADTGRTLLLFKDSYANCFVQFLTPYYDRILMIAPRYSYDDLGALMRREAPTDVLFLYNCNTFVQDHALAVVLQSALAEQGE